ncbi:hypothetical protein D3C76_780230 [compost metagenome]
MLAQLADEIACDEAVVAHLHGMSQGSPCRVLRQGRGPQGAGGARHLQGRRGMPGQQAEEAFQQFLVIAQAGRKLPEKGAELFPQLQRPRGEEVRKAFLGVAQAPDMGDEARPLHAEAEIRRRLRMPAAVALGSLQAVEGAVQLDAVEYVGGVAQLVLLAQAGRIEQPAPGSVAPPRYADMQSVHGRIFILVSDVHPFRLSLPDGFDCARPRAGAPHGLDRTTVNPAPARAGGGNDHRIAPLQMSGFIARSSRIPAAATDASRPPGWSVSLRHAPQYGVAGAFAMAAGDVAQGHHADQAFLPVQHR